MSNISKGRLVFDATVASASDNVGAYVTASDGTLITHTGGALDVNIGSVVDLDIRDLDATQDNVAISDGTDTLAINGDGSLNAVVSATDLDIRDLANTQDSVAIGDETNIIDLQALDSAFGATAQTFPISGVRRDADTSPVSADGDAHPFVFDADGQLKVRANVVASVEPSDAEYAEDSAHTSGDVGLHMLSVRQDTLAASTSADGDYASLKVDSLGRLYTAAQVSGDVADDAADSGNPMKVGSRADDAATALSAVADGDRADMLSDLYRRIYVNDSPNIGSQATDQDVTTTASELAASPLAGRRRIMIQNLGARAVYIGEDNTVTTATGLEVAAGATLTLEAGPAVDFWAIAASGTQDVRIYEIA